MLYAVSSLSLLFLALIYAFTAELFSLSVAEGAVFSKSDDPPLDNEGFKVEEVVDWTRLVDLAVDDLVAALEVAFLGLFTGVAFFGEEPPSVSLSFWLRAL